MSSPLSTAYVQPLYTLHIIRRQWRGDTTHLLHLEHLKFEMHTEIFQDPCQDYGCAMPRLRGEYTAQFAIKLMSYNLLRCLSPSICCFIPSLSWEAHLLF